MLRPLADALLRRLPSASRRDAKRALRTLARGVYRAYARPAHAAAAPLLAAAAAGGALGTSIPRVFWHHFLDAHRPFFRGRAVEIDTVETVRAYGRDALTGADVLDAAPGPGVDVVADLSAAWAIPDARYDVFLLQFAIHMIEHDEDALYHALRILKPGGVLLCSFPAVSGYPAAGVDYRGEAPAYVHHWYTPGRVVRTLDRLVPHEAYHLQVYGNRHAYAAYIRGLGAEALPHRTLFRPDPHWPVVSCAAVVKPADWSPSYVPSR